MDGGMVGCGRDDPRDPCDPAILEEQQGLVRGRPTTAIPPRAVLLAVEVAVGVIITTFIRFLSCAACGFVSPTGGRTDGWMDGWMEDATGRSAADSARDSAAAPAD